MRLGNETAISTKNTKKNSKLTSNKKRHLKAHDVASNSYELKQRNNMFGSLFSKTKKIPKKSTIEIRKTEINYFQSQKALLALN